MTTDAFKEYVKTCRALDTEEIHRFMDDMSNEAPVSYTHLDVYKRQILHSLIWNNTI